MNKTFLEDIADEDPIFADNIRFFLKRRLSNWLEDNFNSYEELKDCLIDEHNDAAKKPNATQYIKDITELFETFGIDIFDKALYN